MAKKPDDLIPDDEITRLIKCYRDGDQEAFVTLANSCSQAVWIYIRSKASEDDADDLFQEYQLALALALLPGKEPVTTAGHLQGLAVTIGKRLVANFYRSKERNDRQKSKADELAKPGQEDTDDPHRTLEPKDLVEQLLLHTGQTDAQRDAIVFVYLMEQTKRKAAADLGIAEKSLRERLEGAFRKFRDYLKKERNQ